MLTETDKERTKILATMPTDQILCELSGARRCPKNVDFLSREQLASVLAAWRVLDRNKRMTAKQRDIEEYTK